VVIAGTPSAKPPAGLVGGPGRWASRVGHSRPSVPLVLAEPALVIVLRLESPRPDLTASATGLADGDLADLVQHVLDLEPRTLALGGDDT
jgi:hypothetical protein